MHVILGFKPLSKCFQSPKNVIKAKDARLALIDVAVPNFLLVEPPLAGTQDAQLPTPLAAKILYLLEPPIPSDEEAKDSTLELVQQEVTDKDFEVFYQQKDPEDAPRTSHRPLCLAQVNSNQEGTNILEGMGFEEKTPNLLDLLMAHTGGFSPAIPVVPQPPTPALTRASSIDAADKKIKRGQGGKGIEGAEEGKVTHSSHQSPAKEARTMKGQKKKSTSFGTSKESMGTDHPSLLFGDPPSY